MATALLSLALNVPLPTHIAMTGELTLTGMVLKIGGLREKVIAAKRANVTIVVCPKANFSDWEELPQEVKEGIQPKFVDCFDEIPPIFNLTKDMRKPEWLVKEKIE